MKYSISVAGRVLLTGVMAVLAGCGGNGKVTVSPTKYRLLEIRGYTYSGTTPTQTSRQSFSYNSGNEPETVIYFKGKGANGAWGDNDDVISYYVSCAYSGKMDVGAYDLESEIYDGLNSLFTGFGVALGGITQEDVSRSCASNYNNQSALTMKLYNGPGADGVWKTADDAVLATINWKMPGTAADSEVTVTAPSVTGYTATTTLHDNYAFSNGAIRDLVRPGYYRHYELNPQNRPTRISMYSYSGPFSAWLSRNAASDLRLEHTDFSYGTNDVVKCHYDLMGMPTDASRDVIVNGLLSERQRFDAGLDLTPCTGDDAVTYLEGFTFEKAQ
ncbi:hypothetical protein [Fluviicoccus keumensis]|uniref:hypothetical protein n=1 Tax=Fluviicoccus keumensis TaxID=1435465 RepID=UPI00102B6235|nr:hypothetical protein [Fluviicoccus keumensis]